MTYIGAIDQGTTNTRFMIFDESGSVVASAQREHQQIFPRPGWVEHNPIEIRDRTYEVIGEALKTAGLTATDLAAVGITNQRETTVLWNRKTGEPVMNAIVWQDTRTAGLVAEIAGSGGIDRFRAKTGLPLATYFSGPKVAWVLDHDSAARSRATTGELAFGTMDTWIVWWLTGGPDGGQHVTDVTNASRTMLMDLQSLQWDKELLKAFDIPAKMLPEIKSSSEIYGTGVGPLEGVPIAAILGDQQAALVGQACFSPGDAKNTYGTGCFLLMNTGTKPQASEHGLLTTVAYRFGKQAPVYALEGSVAIAGALIQWLRDNLGIIGDASEVEALARSVNDNGDVYFVPAFSGLFAPHWRSDARGVVTGLTRFANRGHIARASLEATAYQTREVIEAMRSDSGVELSELKVDGGMVGNELLMQFQADLLGTTVVRPEIAETSALGAAYAAGMAVGVWSGPEEVAAQWTEAQRWESHMRADAREALYGRWGQAVKRSLDWV